MAKLVATSCVILATIIISNVQSRELRPSEHGLPFNDYPARSPGMELFFGEDVSPPAERPPAQVNIENSSNSASDSWLKGAPGREEDRVRNALVVATIICCGAGVVLLAAAAVLFAIYFKRQRSVSTTSSKAAADNINKSPAIVAAAQPPLTK